MKVKTKKNVDVSGEYKLIERQYRNGELIKEVLVATADAPGVLDWKKYSLHKKRTSQSFSMVEKEPLDNEVLRVEGDDPNGNRSEIVIIRYTAEVKTVDEFFKSLNKLPKRKPKSDRVLISTTAPPDSRFASNVTTLKETSPVKVPDGIYTAVFSNGDYRTLRVKTQAKDALSLQGKTIVSYLHGPDNEKDYSGFGFINNDKDHDEVFQLWKRFKDVEGEPSESAKSLVKAVKILISNPKGAGMEYAKRSGNCYRCGRTLTVPTSLHAGLGPECIKKI